MKLVVEYLKGITESLNVEDFEDCYLRFTDGNPEVFILLKKTPTGDSLEQLRNVLDYVGSMGIEASMSEKKERWERLGGKRWGWETIGSIAK
jgi:hypothetical protein